MSVSLAVPAARRAVQDKSGHSCRSGTSVEHKHPTAGERPAVPFEERVGERSDGREREPAPASG